MGKRDLFWDIIKGIAIILVVIGHSIQYNNGPSYFVNGLFWDNPIQKFIYSFHMPLFMIVSGYFGETLINKYNCIGLMTSRAKQLILPIFSYYILTSILFGFPDHMGSSYYIKFSLFNYVLSFLSTLWFLWAIFFSQLCLFFYKNSKLNYIFLFISAILVMMIVPDHPLTFAYWKFCFPPYIFGIFVRKYHLMFFLDNHKVFITLILLFFYIFLFYFYNIDSYVYTTLCYIFKKHPFYQIYIDIYRSVIGIVGGMMIISFTRMFYSLIKSYFFGRVLAYLGKNSFGIYIISSLIVELSIRYNNYYLVPCTLNVTVSSIVTIIICLIVILILKSNTITKTLFLGGR